jgi:hypothetical protein
VTRLRTALALTLTVPLLALGACSEEDPQPKIAPSESSSPTESPSASSSASPQALSETQTVRRFFEGISASISAGDSSRFMTLAAKRCTNCQEIAQSLENAYADGGHIENGRWTVVRLQRVSGSPQAGLWNVDIQTAKERWFDGEGQLVKVVTPDKLKFKVAVFRRSDAWKIRELRLV